MVHAARRTSLLVAFCALAGGAAANTPQQDRAWAAYAACRAEGRVTNVYIERVEPDGQWLATTTSINRSSYGLQELEACMREHLSQTR